VKDLPSRFFVTVSLISLFTVGAHPSTSEIVPAGEARQDPAINAVYDYVQYQFPGLGKEERDAILRDHLVTEIQGWPFQAHIKEHRLFAFPKGTNPMHGIYLLTVDKKLTVWPLRDRRDFNELLQLEGIRIESKEDALDAAQLFLKCFRVRNVLYLGYKLGVNVIASVDDIKFKTEAEKVALSREFTVRPPQLTKDGEGFHYTLFSWEPEGSGALERHDLLMDDKGIVKSTSVLLRNRVGSWVGER